MMWGCDYIMNSIDYLTDLDLVNKQLQDGAFLIVRSENKLNTMTIGWGMIGYIWNKPIFQVLVRPSRYTYELIKNTDNFSVSVPYEFDMNKELAYCGSKSGRDVDKFSELDLNIIESPDVQSPFIKRATYHYSCKILYQDKIIKTELDNEITKSFYSNEDYHFQYYGEIISAYKN